MKAERGIGIDGELASLAARVVGVEHEASLVGAAEKHDADRRLAVGVGGRQRNGRRVDLVRLRALDRLEEFDDWVGTRHAPAAIIAVAPEANRSPHYRVLLLSILVYAGLASLLLGLLTVVRPMRWLGVPSRARGLAAVVVGAVLLAVGCFWPTPLIRASGDRRDR